MDESARSTRNRHQRPTVVFIATILLVAAFWAVFAYRFYDKGVPIVTETSSSASSSATVASSLTTTSTSVSTISIANSTTLPGIETATGNTGGELIDPTLDSNTGQIYAITSTKGVLYNTLTTIDTTRLVARAALTLPGSGVTLAVDPKTNMIYVQVYGCNEGVQVPNSCASNRSGFTEQEILRINGSTDAIEGETPILTNSTNIAINPNTNTLYAIQSCPHANSSSPCGRLLAFDAGSGTLTGNLTMKAILGALLVNPVTNTVYIVGGAQVNSRPTQTVVAVDARNLTVNYYVPLNYTNTLEMSINDSTNTVYVFADNNVGNTSSAVLAAIFGRTGSVLFSVVVGTACSVYGGGIGVAVQGATVNTATNQVYLYTGAQVISAVSQTTFTVFDGATGRAVGMLYSSSTIQTSLFDPSQGKVYVIFDGGGIATIPSAVIEGNVNQGILNVTCPPNPLPR